MAAKLLRAIGFFRVATVGQAFGIVPYNSDNAHWCHFGVEQSQTLAYEKKSTNFWKLPMNSIHEILCRKEGEATYQPSASPVVSTTYSYT